MVHGPGVSSLELQARRTHFPATKAIGIDPVAGNSFYSSINSLFIYFL
jgi:hypothetical protein